MQVGSLGDIIFEVSDSTVLTFYDYSRKSQAKFAMHEIICQKPKLEFLGAEIEEISFSIKLSAFRGINPTEQAEKIRTMIETGEAVRLIMVNTPVGKNNWVIESMNEKANYYDGAGRVISSDIELTLKEYVITQEDNQ